MPEDILPELDENLQHIDTIHQEIHNIFRRDLPFSVPQQQGFVQQVGEFLSKLPESSRIVFSCKGEVHTLSADKAHELLRIIQEFVQNTIKHAPYDEAFILLQFAIDHIHIHLKNGGRGAGAEHGKVMGIGLESIRQRMTKIKGAMQLSAGKEFDIRLYVPYN